MGLFDRIFGYSNKYNNDARNEKVVRILELKEFLDSLLADDRYIAKSDYVDKTKEYKDVVEYFHVLSDSGMAEAFCKSNGMKIRDLQLVLSTYSDIENLVEQHNDRFIQESLVKEKEYFP